VNINGDILTKIQCLTNAVECDCDNPKLWFNVGTILKDDEIIKVNDQD
jgi:hypothetical protein